MAHVLRQISIEGLPVAAMKALMAAEGTTHERRRRSHLVKFVAVVTERGGDVNDSGIPVGLQCTIVEK